MKKAPIPFPNTPGEPSAATMRAFIATFWNTKADALEAFAIKSFRQSGEARELAKSAARMPDATVKAVFEALQGKAREAAGNVVEPGEGVN